jgi:hypothetical protein
MNRTTVVILGGTLLVAVLLCASLFAGWLASRDQISSDWEPSWDRDRTQWESPTGEPVDGSAVGMCVLGLLGLLSCLLLAGGLVLCGAWLANRRRANDG